MALDGRSTASHVVDEESMRPGHWLALVLCVPFSTTTTTTCVSWQSSYELEDFIGAVYCQHAVTDGNQRTRIMENTLEFSVMVLRATPSRLTRCLLEGGA